MDVAEVAGSGTNTRLADPGAITPVTAGAWIYVMGGAGCSTGGTYTNGELTAFLAETQVDTNDGNIGAGYLEWDGLGEYNPAAFAGGGTDTLNDSWVSMTLALRPFIPTPITLSAESGTFTWTGTAANLSVSGGEEAAEFSAYSGFQPVIMCN
jgi:hypothetical protein